MKSQWWFARSDFSNGSSKLESPTVAGSEDFSFKDAQKMSVTVEGAFIRENMDGNFITGDNDLVIATRHRVGSRPTVDKIHFLRAEVPAKTWLGPFFHPVVYASDDFKTSDSDVTLQVRIYDEDGLGSAEAETLDRVINGAAGSASVAFPAFAPFAGIAGDAGGALLTLVDTLDGHDRIIDSTIRLAVNKPAGQGFDLLQPGFLICFDKEVDGSELSLQSDKRVYQVKDGKSQLMNRRSYIVLRVQRDFISAPDLELDERGATLLAEIERGKGSQSGQALTFLRETFSAYTKFRKLERAQELQAQSAELAKKGEKLSKDEQELLKKLTTDAELKPFLNGALPASKPEKKPEAKPQPVT